MDHNGSVPIVFALLAALGNALNVVMQHIASTGDPAHRKGWQFVRYLVANPLWLFGWVALAGAFVFQALALHNGLMSVVQPLLVTELVFALVLRRVWIRQSIRAVTWWTAGLTCASLAVFLAAAEPTAGVIGPTMRDWVGATGGGRGRRGGALPLLVARFARPACCPPRRGHGRVVGARRNLHQGDDRFAHPVRRRRHVRPLAGLRAGGQRHLPRS